jgi:hypothetical protein
VNAALWGQIIVAIVAVAGSILGYVLAGVNDARRDRRVAAHDAIVRREERATTALQEQPAFQRATLLDLQDSIQLMARLTGRAMHFDHMQAREGEYTQLPPGYSDEMFENGVEVTRLRNRILNNQLRMQIAAFTMQCTEASMSPTRYQNRPIGDADDVALALMRQFNIQVETVMDAVGEALRANLRYMSDIERQPES